MRFMYPAIIKKVRGGYTARFPDLACCEAEGRDLEDVLEHARDALEGWIRVEFEEEEPAFPPVSDPEDLELKKGEFVRQVLIVYRFYEGWDE